MKFILIVPFLALALSSCDKKTETHTDYPDQVLKFVALGSNAEIANKGQVRCDDLILVKADKAPIINQDFYIPAQNIRIRGQSFCTVANSILRTDFDYLNKRYVSFAEFMQKNSISSPLNIPCSFSIELLNPDLSSKKYFLRSTVNTDNCRPHIHHWNFGN